MNMAVRLTRLLAAGKGRGLAERQWAKLPLGRPLAALPHFPEHPRVPPIRHHEGGGPPKVLVAGHSLRLEGAPLSQWELVTVLAQARVIDPVVAVSLDGPLRAAYADCGIPVHVGLPALSSLYGGADFSRAAAELAAQWRGQEIDLVWAFTLLTAPAVEAARLAGLPAVWNPRESLPPHLAFRPFGASVAARSLACMRHPHATVFVAEASRALWARFDDGRFHTIANALPPDRVAALGASDERKAVRARLGVEDDAVLLLVPGTICARKGQRDIAAAFRLMPPEAARRLRIVMVGDRGEEDYARRLDHDLRHLPAGVAMEVPAQARMAPWFQAADLLAMPSRSESAPRVVLEALAAGLPMVVSPVFGVAEQVGDNDGALFCAAGDVATLARHLARLALSADMRGAMAAKARRRFAEINDFTGMVRRYGSLLLAAARGDAIGGDATCVE